MDKGAFFPDCRHLASTFSSTSLATLATGSWPAEHGIVADSWYDRASRRAVPATDEMLIGTTLAAQAVADPARHVSVIGLDERHARLFAGTPDANVYWTADNGEIGTTGETSDWLANFNAHHTLDGMHDRKWMAIGAKAETPPLRTLTFDAKHPEQFLALYRSSPFAQDTQFDLLQELIAHETPAQAGSPHLICLLSGPIEQLGYETGARSFLMQQMVLHLDRRLEELFGQLTRAAGDGGFGLVVVGAHGAPPEPPEESRSRMAVNGEQIAAAVARSLESNGFGRVIKYVYPFLYLDTGGFRDPEPIRLAAARAALEQSAVAGFYTWGGASSVRNDWAQRYRNSFHPVRSGDLMLSYRPEYVEDFGAGRGVSYGSLYDYDVRVPLCLLGPQFKPGVFESPVESVDVAPTLARVLGAAPPSSSSGRVLAEALA